MLVPPWHQILCPSIEEIGVKRLQPEVTVCFTLGSLAIHLPASCLFRSPKRCKSLDPYYQLDLWLVTAWWVRVYEPPSLQYCSSTQWFPSVWIPSEVLGCWQMIISRRWHEAGSHGHLAPFFQQQDTSLGAMMGQMFKCQWSWHEGLTCSICYICATYTLISE